MKYIFIFLIIVVILVFAYFIYTQFPDITENIENTVESYTGITRKFLSKNITDEFDNFSFTNLVQTDREYIYYYDPGVSEEKRIAFLIASKSANVLFDGEEIKNYISETKTTKTFSIVLPENLKSNIIVQTWDKPKLYIGIQNANERQ